MVLYVQPNAGTQITVPGIVTKIIPKRDISFHQSTYSLSDSYVTCTQSMGLLIPDKQSSFVFTVQNPMYRS